MGRVTDEERREVARRLRNNASQDMAWLIPWAVFNDAEQHAGEAVVLRLADLIEPGGADPGPRDRAGVWGGVEMMPTDTERRDVARRLRKMDYADLKESLICAYLDALGIEGYADWVDIAHVLAELIDPDSRHEDFCKVCGHVIPDGWSECPRCKSKAVSDD